MRNDMTAGSEWKHILLFSLPILLGNLLQQLYNTVDGIVVGNYVSESALAAVGSCTELATVFLAIALGMSSGASILVAQLFGARRYGELKRAASTALLLLLSLGVIASVLGALGANWLLRVVMNLEKPDILAMATEYFAIYAVGLVFQFAYNIIASILRAIGDSRATLYFLCVTAVLNLLLDLLFVIVFRWGVRGAAAATVLSQLVCTAVSGLYMYKKYEIFRFTRRELVFDAGMGRTCVAMGIPTTLQQCVLSFGHVFVQRLVNSFEEATMSAFTVGNRIEMYVLMPCMSFNIGMATFAGQNIGAGRPDRVRRGLYHTVVMSLIACTALAALAFFLDTPIAALFGVQGEALRQSAEFIRFITVFVPMMAIYMPIGGMLQGCGDVFYATLCTFSGLMVRVAAAYMMAYWFAVGYASVWICVPIGWVFSFGLAVIRFANGKWKTKNLVKKALKGEPEALTEEVVQ